ncbi:Integral membrane protein CcmA involved in cell shape determination [Echinicola vietnamensis DSM 17526]|uniref:Integral membrane protein CcmA involved in cell shape determination n=2 Tax=Echinicola TaxID=390846 RepID=L0FV32_ECHVK|nr:Integral membrane protein CcmA involved in cell shape determination [Echinicola vietnamensis DSM 17526]
MVNSSNVIAKETSIKGDIITQGNIRIEGKVDGTLSSKTKIVIGESAKLIGNIDTKEAEIAGNVEGEVRCSDILFLKKTAVINGNIFTKKLVIENGAVFNGACSMTDHAAKQTKSESNTVSLKNEKSKSEKEVAAG